VTDQPRKHAFGLRERNAWLTGLVCTGALFAPHSGQVEWRGRPQHAGAADDSLGKRRRV